MKRINVRKVGILGAGVMGAQIAAHLANLGIQVVLFDLAAPQGARNGQVLKALDNLRKLKPSPLAVPENAALIHAANYDDDLPTLAGCDLVIEAIAERMDYKRDLYARIAPHLAPDVILASNTSGLSITVLSAVLPAALRPRFCGIHFFNPPRYMHLVELIPAPETAPEILDQLESFVTSGLGKGVVRAKDTPNFVANRIGVAGVLTIMKEAEIHGLPPDIVDDLTGSKLGRASSGTYRTGDVVGLDTMAHVIKTLQDNLPDDPFHPVYATPPLLSRLLELGALGQKSGAGFFKKQGRDILRFDAAQGDYVPAGGKADPEVAALLKLPAAERLRRLRESDHPQAQFVWAVLRDSFHYAAVHLEQVAETARDIDLAMRWGFGNRQGPFELWQEAGWLEVAGWIQQDIEAGRALSTAPLPDWVFQGPVPEKGIHTPEGSWSPAQRRYLPRSGLPVYQRHYFPEDVRGSGAPDPLRAGTELFRNDAVRAWTLDGEVVIATITTKLHLISPSVAQGLLAALALAETSYKGLVIWSPDDVFSAGANLEALKPIIASGDTNVVKAGDWRLQETMLALRYASVPVVAAMRGLALGGGCELAVHCARRVASMETYIGLVEVGVGLIPGAGGLTYIARRAAEIAQTANASGDLLKILQPGFGAVATARVSSSASEARQMGYLLESDVIVPNRDELLHVACLQARTMYDSGWHPPARIAFPVAGRDAIATIKGQLANMRDGGFISPHDHLIATCIAEVICGGDVDAGSLVTEEYLMGMEIDRFAALLAHPKTQERIKGMLETGKPVRN